MLKPTEKEIKLNMLVEEHQDIMNLMNTHKRMVEEYNRRRIETWNKIMKLKNYLKDEVGEGEKLI